MDAIELVKKDHDKVEELFARFKGGGGVTGLVRRMTGNVTSRERKTAVAGICQELDVHAKIEEEILYPAIIATGDPELRKMIDEAIREHAGVKAQIAALRQHPDDEDLDAKVSQLESDVNHHVREEENEMLPRVEERIPENERAALGRRMQQRKRALSGRATPATARRASTTKTTSRRTTTTAGKKAARPRPRGGRQRARAK